MCGDRTIAGEDGVVSTRLIRDLDYLLIPVTHALFGIVFLVSARLSVRTRRLGIAFISIALFNGLMLWVAARRRSFDAWDEISAELLALLLGLMQAVLYVFVLINLWRLCQEFQRLRDSPSGANYRLPLTADALRPWRPQHEGGQDAQP
jgi:hypothetical protein